MKPGKLMGKSSLGNQACETDGDNQAWETVGEISNTGVENL